MNAKWKDRKNDILTDHATNRAKPVYACQAV